MTEKNQEVEIILFDHPKYGRSILKLVEEEDFRFESGSIDRCHIGSSFVFLNNDLGLASTATRYCNKLRGYQNSYIFAMRKESILENLAMRGYTLVEAPKPLELYPIH